MEGVAKASGASTAFVLGNDRIQAKVQNLVEKSLLERMVLQRVYFPQIGSKLAESSRSFKETPLFEEQRFFFLFEGLSEEQFR